MAKSDSRSGQRDTGSRQEVLEYRIKGVDIQGFEVIFATYLQAFQHTCLKPQLTGIRQKG